ncbi:HD domain-containing protein [Schaalia cardiffensis]|uniref:HD domain-containing protein n=1 Tax=Schaalia cardiffensis TaxID=181487 RepID=UPI0023EFB952|nr:hypothetical protein [Schaalia cardiffensis]
MGAEAPQWLFSSFTDTMQEIGASAPLERLDAEAHDLVAHWSAPERRLHNTRHLIDVLAHIDELAATSHDPDVLRVAAWYHGIALNRCLSIRVQGTDPVSAENLCVDITRTRLLELGVSEDVIDRVAELLSYIARHRAPRTDVDAQVLVDADLAMLAVSPQEYKKFRENLRAELSDVEETEYLRARRAVVKQLLSFNPLYQSPLGEAWDSAARANLEVELAKLDSALRDCADDSSADEAEPDPSGSIDDEGGSTTGTIIIKRRQLKKKASASPDEFTSTGLLPKIAPVPETQVLSSEEDSASSLEMAIEALDLPSTPSK